MSKLIFLKALLLGLFTISLHANFYVKQNFAYTDLYVGQLFEIEIETISLESSQRHFFDFENMEGVRIVNPLQPKIKKDNIRTYYKFYFVAQDKTIQTPDIVITIIDGSYSTMQREVLQGRQINATKLNPPENFSGILAKSLVVEGFKSSVYDSESNIVALKLFGAYSDLEEFTIYNALNASIQEHSYDHPNQEISYYAILAKEIDTLRFSYFDIDSKRYKHIEFPIHIQRDSVSTQTELHPQKSRVYQLKIYGSLLVFLFFFTIFLFKRSYSLLFIALLCLAYLLYTIKPLATVEIQEGTVVYILPTQNATPVVKVDRNTQVKRLSSYESYYKVEFDDGLIGWVKKDNSVSN